jgi:translation initiation factor 1A
MGKNHGKGGKSKRKGKNKNYEQEKRELILKEGDEQEYAQATRNLGHCRLEVYCFDGTTRLGHVRGKFRKKVCFLRLCVSCVLWWVSCVFFLFFFLYE